MRRVRLTMTMLGRCRHGQRTSSAPVHFGRHLGHLPAKVVAAGPHAHHQHALAHEPVVVAGLVIAAVELAAGEVFLPTAGTWGLKVAVANHDGVKYPVVSLLVTPGSTRSLHLPSGSASSTRVFISNMLSRSKCCTKLLK